MIEMADPAGTLADVRENLAASTRGRKRGRKPKAAKKATEPRTPARIGIEMPDELSLELAAYCEAHPLVNASALKNIVREKAREAACDAVVGQVAVIAQGAL